MFRLYRLLKSVFQPLAATLGLPPHSCRFKPSCSHYCEQSINRFGLLKGSKLCINRLLRCQPGKPSGPDPVPNS